MSLPITIVPTSENKQGATNYEDNAKTTARHSAPSQRSPSSSLSSESGHTAPPPHPLTTRTVAIENNERSHQILAPFIHVERFIFVKLKNMI